MGIFPFETETVGIEDFWWADAEPSIMGSGGLESLEMTASGSIGRFSVAGDKVSSIDP